MIFLVAGVLSVAALIGGLTTYSGIKMFEKSSPTAEHVGTLVNNQFLTKEIIDQHHESMQNFALFAIIVVGVVISGILIYITFIRRSPQPSTNATVQYQAQPQQMQANQQVLNP